MVQMDKKSVSFLHKVVVALFSGLNLNARIEYDHIEHTLYIDGWLWATSTTVEEEVATINGAKVKSTEGFVIGTTSLTPATRWEPEEYDTDEVATVKRADEAARKIAELYFGNLINGQLEAMDTAELAEELRANKERFM